MAAALAVGGLQAASSDARVEAFFRPPIAGQMALSPDGRRLAYTTQTGSDLAIVLVELEPPGPRRTIRVEYPPGTEPAPGRPAPPLRFLRWATADRLVYALPERVIPLPPIVVGDGQSAPNPDGPTIVSPILAVDADGRQRGTLVDARDFMDTSTDARRSLADLLRTTQELVKTKSDVVRWRMPHLDILGHFPADREQLVIGTRGGFGPPARHLVDVRTGGVREFGGEWAVPPGEPHVFDWHRLKVVGERRSGAGPATVWHDAELRLLQRVLETKFPRRSVEILDWSETRSRVLVRVTGGSDPGRIFVYQRPEDIPLEVLRRAPWLPPARLHETRSFSLPAADGDRLTGYVTWPSRSRHAAPPVLVVFPEAGPAGESPSFDPEVQALAEQGFAVVRLNPRAAAGGPDEAGGALPAAFVRTAAADARAAVAWVASRHPERSCDVRRVALLGRGVGGYLAVRALEAEPGAFRCAVALSAPLARGRGGPAADAAIGAPAAAGPRERRIPMLVQVGAPAHPVLFLIERGADPAVDAGVDEWRARLERLGRPAEFLLVEAQADDEAAAARAGRLCRQIGAFLGRHLAGEARPAAGAGATGGER